MIWLTFSVFSSSDWVSSPGGVSLITCFLEKLKIVQVRNLRFIVGEVERPVEDIELKL
jgi:hypothetical protein